MKTIATHAFEVTTRLAFEDAIARMTQLLADIDVRATLKKRLDLEYKPYRILGACYPIFAHRALEAEQHLGVLLPCNVVVWDDGDQRVVAAMEPKVMGAIIDSPAVREVADEVSARLHRVLERLD